MTVWRMENGRVTPQEQESLEDPLSWLTARILVPLTEQLGQMLNIENMAVDLELREVREANIYRSIGRSTGVAAYFRLQRPRLRLREEIWGGSSYRDIEHDPIEVAVRNIYVEPMDSHAGGYDTLREGQAADYASYLLRQITPFLRNEPALTSLLPEPPLPTQIAMNLEEYGEAMLPHLEALYHQFFETSVNVRAQIVVDYLGQEASAVSVRIWLTGLIDTVQHQAGAGAFGDTPTTFHTPAEGTIMLVDIDGGAALARAIMHGGYTPSRDPASTARHLWSHMRPHLEDYPRLQPRQAILSDTTTGRWSAGMRAGEALDGLTMAGEAFRGATTMVENYSLEVAKTHIIDRLGDGFRDIRVEARRDEARQCMGFRAEAMAVTSTGSDLGPVGVEIEIPYHECRDDLDGYATAVKQISGRMLFQRTEHEMYWAAIRPRTTTRALRERREAETVEVQKTPRLLRTRNDGSR